MQTVANTFLWSIFIIIVVIMLVIDLTRNKFFKNKIFLIKKAMVWSLFWLVITLIFNIFFWIYLFYSQNKALANIKALEFFTSYIIEKILSIDNLFVWFMLFKQYSVPLFLQHRILTYGVLGSIILRILMVFISNWFILKNSVIFYIFGTFLLLTNIKILLFKHKKKKIREYVIFNWVYRTLQITNKFYGEHFFIYRNKTLFITPLLLVLIMIGFSDMLFAMDSIPAIFSITTDPFIILTSNVFAVLGLKVIYFLLANIIERFSLFRYGLAGIMCFIGIKMLIIDFVHIPITISFLIIITTLLLSILFTLRYDKMNKK